MSKRASGALHCTADSRRRRKSAKRTQNAARVPERHFWQKKTPLSPTTGTKPERLSNSGTPPPAPASHHPVLHIEEKVQSALQNISGGKFLSSTHQYVNGKNSVVWNSTTEFHQNKIFQFPTTTVLMGTFSAMCAPCLNGKRDNISQPNRQQQRAAGTSGTRPPSIFLPACGSEKFSGRRQRAQKPWCC